MKKILILGTGQAQKDLINYCKNNNLYVLGCSSKKNDVGESLLNDFRQINITDVEAVQEYAKVNDVNYVYSVGSDIAMPTVNIVSENLKLPHFISSECAIICNTKNLLREKLKTQSGFNVKYFICKNIEDVERIELDYPLVMKPVDSQGQRGVYKVNNKNDVLKYFQESMSFSRKKEIIVEEYIEGTEVSVNCLVKNGKLIFILVSDRESWKEYPGGIIHKHYIISKFDKDIEISKKIRMLVEESIKSLGINDGPVYFQLKIKNEIEPKIIEITPRLDGCHMWKLIKYSTGIDILDITMKMLMNKYMSDIEIEYNKNNYITEFLCSKPGFRFNKQNYHVENSEEVCWYYSNGDEVQKMNGYMEKCGYRIYKGE